MRVLVADDCREIRDRLVLMLQEIEGVAEIDFAADGNEAVESLLNRDPDFLVLDLSLPRRSGFEVLEFIREHDLRVRTIVLTNYWYPPFRKKSFEVGAEYFFDKSIDFNKVREVIETEVYRERQRHKVA